MSATVKHRASLGPKTHVKTVPSTASDVPSHWRRVTTALLTNLEKKTFVTNWLLSSGTRMLADAKAIATMLAIEAMMKIVSPITHVRLVCGLDWPHAFMPSDCRFCPMLMPTDAMRPMRIPTTTRSPLPSASHTTSPVALRW